MGDSLLERTENKLAKVISRNASLQNTKSELPFAIINVDGKFAVQHLFHIPEDKDVFDLEAGGKAKFAVVLGDGSFIVYDTMFRRVAWKRHVSIDQVNWGGMLWEKEITNPTMLLNSRKLGYFSLNLEVKEDDLEPVILSKSPHSGLCKPCICSDFDIVIVPIDLDKIGVHTLKKRSLITSFHHFDSTLMAMKILKMEVSSVLIACSTEAGDVQLLKINLSTEDKSPTKCELLSTFTLPKDKRENQPSTGTCLEGNEQILIVGTTTKVIYLLSVSAEYCLKPHAKKILPTDGVNILAMNKEKTTLAAGCFDGTIRIFSFPDMNQISAIHYYVNSLNSLLFMNDKERKNSSYLICSTNTNIVTVWRLSSHRDGITS